MTQEVSRRDFLARLGVTVGTAAAGAAAAAGVPLAAVPLVSTAHAQPKGNIPDTPYKIAHMTFFTGAAAVLGEPSFKGHTLAAEEINAQGGLLGKRKIETLKADENAGTDANVKEMRRLKLSEKIDLFTGVISSGNTPALGPVAEELKLLTIFVDGCTDFLFDKVVPNPHHIFRITNMQSADGVTCAVATAMTWGKQIKRVAHIHPDYTYGRNAFAHFNIVMKKMVPGAQVVSEGWPKLGTTDFTSHITKAIAAKPDLLVSSVWGGDYVAMYKQALRYDMFKKMKFASTIAFGVAPHAIGKDHPEGAIAGVHSNYYFNYPPQDRWPLNTTFVKKYYERWKEYPNFQSEGAYTTLYLLKQTIEKANKLTGGWPDDEVIISQLEGASISGPAGYLHIRPDNHQGYKDAMTGFSMNSPDYPFQILDPNRIITIPIRNITAPPGWPAPTGEDTRTYSWIDKTWPQLKA
ncbi:MAG TPA: ABC transporter substrate-binding protein [Candidatus Acidoferrum sp.]|jgi:branched-chain amino acid transport system substrate-binding protein|nr:ABC transporter substrate-binding protein [Candidatus Acidoferrum sp.]